MPTATTEDTEITLGTGKMLGLFFGLVALCAVFFAMGFKLGHSSIKTDGAAPAAMATVNGGGRPSATKPGTDLSFYKSVGEKDPNANLPASQDASTTQTTPDSNTPNPAPDPMAVSSTNGYFVQVAAVSKQEDAQALVEALRKKQYQAFAANVPSDSLFHVQVGPFADIKQAEEIRSKLVSDGYNPILKK